MDTPKQFDDLPTEILLMIVQPLDPGSVKSLILVSKTFSTLFRPYIYQELRTDGRSMGASKDLQAPYCSCYWVRRCVFYFLKHRDCAAAVRTLHLHTMEDDDEAEDEEHCYEAHNEQLAQEVELRSRNGELDLSFHPDLAESIRQGKHWACEMLLLHLLVGLQKLWLHIGQWGITEALGTILMQKVLAANGELPKLYQALPHGLLHVRKYVALSSDDQAGVQLNWVIGALFFPRIQRISVGCVSNVFEAPAALSAWNGKSNLHGISFEASVVNNCHLVQILRLCGSLQKFSYEIQDRLAEAHAYDPEDDRFTFSDVFLPVRSTLRSLTIYGDIRVWIRANPFFFWSYIGPLKEFTSLERIMLPWDCMTSEPTDLELIDWSVMLPPKMKKFYLSGRPLFEDEVITDYEIFQSALQAKIANPDLALEVICMFSRPEEGDERLIYEAEGCGVQVTYRNENGDNSEDEWTSCYLGTLEKLKKY